MKHFPISSADEAQLTHNAGTILGQTGLMQTVADTIGGDWGKAIAATAGRIHDANTSTSQILAAARDAAEVVDPGGPNVDPAPPVEVPDVLPEPSEFAEGGEYEWLDDAINPSDWPAWAYQQAEGQGLISAEGMIRVDSPAWKDLGPDRMQVTGGWNSDQFVDMVSHNYEGAFINMGSEHPWGDTCLWGTRVYNARGTHGHRVVMRCGDFKRGKEGHVVYVNAAADFELCNVIGIQHGAQLAQVVWRPGETLLALEDWPESKPDGKLHLHHLLSIDGGVINSGVAVRASWPVSIFTPGHPEILVEHLYQRTAHAVPFNGGTSGLCRSHGSVMSTKSGNGTDAEGKLFTLREFDVALTESDRAPFRFGDCEEVLVTDGKLAETGSNRGINVLANTKRLRIDPSVDWAGPITVFDPASPYKSPIASYQHTGGTLTDINPNSYL